MIFSSNGPKCGKVMTIVMGMVSDITDGIRAGREYSSGLQGGVSCRLKQSFFSLFSHHLSRNFPSFEIADTRRLMFCRIRTNAPSSVEMACIVMRLHPVV